MLGRCRSPALIYNTTRPHRALQRRTPATIYTDSVKDAPHLHTADREWRVRIDIVDNGGTVTLRYAGTLRHLGIGRAHKQQRVIILASGSDVMVIGRGTGEIIAEFTIDPDRDYQPKRRPTAISRPER